MSPGADSLVGRLLGGAGAVVACARSVLGQLLQQVPGVAEKSSVIYCGVDLPSAPITSPRWEPLRLLCYGRLVERKGFDLALRAVARLRDRLPARLSIAGTGEEEENLRRLCRELELEERVEFLGQVQPAGIPGLLDAASMVLIPSSAEGLPLVAMEALSRARPVVACRVDGMEELVEEAMLVPPRNVDALAERVLALAGNPGEAEQLGRRGRERVVRDFSADRSAGAYLALCRSLCRQ